MLEANFNMQNNNDARLTGAAKPVIFSDGTEILLSPVSDIDSVELDMWVRARYLQIQRESISESSSEELKERIERIAQETASTLCWYLDQGARMMASIDGLSRIIWQCSKNNGHKLTYEQLREKLFFRDNYDRANEAFAEQNNVNVDSVNPTVRGNKRGSKPGSKLIKRTINRKRKNRR